MSSGTLVFHQRYSHNIGLGKRTRLLVVVIINVARETDRTPANNQEEALNFMSVLVSGERIIFLLIPEKSRSPLLIQVRG